MYNDPKSSEVVTPR